jgi:ribosomal protein S18 acetylase RimI-like enzyme
MDREVLRLDLGPDETDLDEQLAAEVRSRSRAFYFAKVDCERVDVVRQLSLAGFFVVDVNVTFALSRSEGTGAPPAGVVVADALPAQGPAILDIAGSCFRYTRFHLDPLVPDPLAHRIKRDWIANYVGKKRGDRLFAAVVDGRPVGFLASLLTGSPGASTATIDLVGVDVAYQGRGVGKSLVEHFIQHYQGSCRVLQVGTQVANVPSTRLYEKLGFSLAKSQYVMHMHVRNGSVER